MDEFLEGGVCPSLSLKSGALLVFLDKPQLHRDIAADEVDEDDEDEEQDVVDDDELRVVGSTRQFIMAAAQALPSRDFIGVGVESWNAISIRWKHTGVVYQFINGSRSSVAFKIF